MSRDASGMCSGQVSVSKDHASLIVNTRTTGQPSIFFLEKGFTSAPCLIYLVPHAYRSQHAQPTSLTCVL